MSTREVRANLADAVNRAIAGDSTFITQNGRRVAKIAPLGATPPTAPTPEHLAAEVALRKHRATLDDFIAACLRAVVATPDSVLRTLKPYWPEKPSQKGKR